MTPHTVLIGGGGGIGTALIAQLQDHQHTVTVISRDSAHHAHINVDTLIGDARDVEHTEQLIRNFITIKKTFFFVCTKGKKNGL